METSDKFTIATFVSLIPWGVALWLAYVYQTQPSHWLLMVCMAITFSLGLSAHSADENEKMPRV